MPILHYTYSRGDSGPINERCPYGVHYAGSDKVFRIGCSACTEDCPHFRKEGSSSSLRRVCCTADDKEAPQTEIQP